MDTQIVQTVSQMTSEIISSNREAFDISRQMIFYYTNKLFCIVALILGGVVLFQWIQRNKILRMIDNRVDEKIKNLDGKIIKMELDMQNTERRMTVYDDWGLALIFKAQDQYFEALYFFVRALRSATKPINVLDEGNSERLVTKVEESMEACKSLDGLDEEDIKKIEVFLNETHLVGFTTRLEKMKQQFAEKVNLFNEHKKSDKPEGNNKK